MSPLGPDFPPERFLRTPITLVRDILRRLDEEEQARANLSSVTTARLASLIHSIALVHFQDQSTKAQPAKDFLPFPDFSPENDKPKPAGPDEATQLTLTELVRKGQLPMHVFTALMHPESGNA